MRTSATILAVKRLLVLLLFVFFASIPARSAPQSDAAPQPGTVEFVAHVAPSAGQAEPVRGFSFYLLTKSFADIRANVAAAEPQTSMDEFIDKLELTPELKTWMKKHKTVTLAGEDFIRSVTVDDVMHVKEFRTAYVNDNLSTGTMGFPTPKADERDKAKNPQKYQKAMDDYDIALRKFMVNNPESISGMDLMLGTINPDRKWQQLNYDRLKRIEDKAFDLAHGKYFAGHAETDSEGHGIFRAIPPGEYWISTLGLDAVIGDARASWDSEVKVTPGCSCRFELSHYKAPAP
ncbi:MAG: hypothetical protein ACRD50_15910 [Candidatus Acidiferrales bacterium]